MRLWPFLVALLGIHAGCGGGGGGGGPAAPPTGSGQPAAPATSVMATFSYLSGGPYANDLRACTYAGSSTQTCALGRLPFLGQDTNAPSVDDVMSRVLISHAWMGDNFRAALTELPEVLPLLRSVTAVVIASDVRPAHYDPNYGAIYLDPDFLWRSAAQRADVSDDPDPRADFGDDLQVQLPWRYVKDGGPLSVLLNPDGSRDQQDVTLILGYLLYHELAHAVDFMALARMPGLDPARTAASYASQGGFLSDGFVAALPLQSNLLEALAGVSFLGNIASAAQRALQPADLVAEFANDGAVQYYAYTAQFEDFATLFETVMMRYRFGYEKDTGITNDPPTGDIDVAIVTWGQRGRIGDSSVNPRALEVVKAIADGNAALEAFVTSRPAPVQLVEGETWGANGQLNFGVPETLGAADAAIRKRTLTVDPILERAVIR